MKLHNGLLLDLGNVKFSNDEFALCYECGRILDKTIDPWMLKVAVRDFKPQPVGAPPHGRARITHEWGFCSKECGVKWWDEQDHLKGHVPHIHGEDLFPILTPADDLPWQQCDDCEGVGRTCPRCHGAGGWEVARFTFCSHDPDHAAHADRFDRNHLVLIMGRFSSEQNYTMLEIYPREGEDLLECGHALNEWYQAPTDASSWSQRHLAEVATIEDIDITDLDGKGTL